jgi:hypothetical protein
VRGVVVKYLQKGGEGGEAVVMRTDSQPIAAIRLKRISTMRPKIDTTFLEPPPPASRAYLFVDEEPTRRLSRAELEEILAAAKAAE